MFSKFDSQINCEEICDYEPTSADWEEYHNWLQDMEASTPTPEPEEEFRLSAPEGWDDDDDDDESIILDRWEDSFDDLRDDEYYENYDFGGSTYDDE